MVEREVGGTSEGPVLPDYAGACVCNIVPALLEQPDDAPAWLPAPAVDASQVLLLVLDGVGWQQLAARAVQTPTLSAMTGGPITTVLPTTTATALTSITTGTTPGEHGVVGYRILVHGEVLNILRWSTSSGDARQIIPPGKVQTQAPFLGHRPPVVTKAEFERTGFTVAHLDGVRFSGWRMASTLVTEVRRLFKAGEPFVYAYYDGVDKVSHEYGLGEHYDAELAAADRLVADLIAAVPPGTAIVVTSDHGQVDVGHDVVPIADEVMGQITLQSGEARFRWLHARPGRAGALLDAATARHSSDAWVVTRDEVIDAGWFGKRVSGEAMSRLGDVALVSKGITSFVEPTDTGPYDLVGRHGSATAAEIYVPLLATRA